MKMRFAWPTKSRSESAGRRVALACLALGLAFLVTGCEYGYSRNALRGGAPDTYAAPQGSISLGYQTGYASPWSFGFSYTYPYSPYYAPYPYYYYPYYPYDPWWYYPPRYAYPWYPYPYYRAPYPVKPAPKRKFRFEPDSSTPSPAPSAPSGGSKRRFNFP
jgi:hypothetical protein